MTKPSNRSHLAIDNWLRQSVALVDKLTQIKHTIFIYTVFEEQGQILCSKQPREKKNFWYVWDNYET